MFKSTKMAPLVIMIVILLAIKGMDGGSVCPSRKQIYPCLCTNVPLSKKTMFTEVTCRNVENTDTLINILEELRQIHIDRFILYDSFLHENDPKKKMLPQNWFSFLKIKESQIIDSDISEDIGCHEILISCPNNVPTHLSIINGSSTNKFITLCKPKSISWINCLGQLQHFEFIHNKLKFITKEFFFYPLRELRVANFSYNEINVIESGAFEKLPKLQSLDLSHNHLTSLTLGLFGVKQTTVLTHLDLSWNMIVQLPSDIFSVNKILKYFSASYNRIEKLPEKDWIHLSKDISTILLEGNPIDCDCHIIWINCTLKVHTTIKGSCKNEKYDRSTLRKVSIHMSEQCVDGVVTNREKNKPRNACLNWNKNSPTVEYLNSDHNEEIEINLLSNRKRNPHFYRKLL